MRSFDHLGNVRAVVGKDANGNMASIVKGRADYYPFGSQFPDKQDLDYRYAYQGQEKDAETSMEAFELRLWDSRIGRWLTPDPYGEYHSPYLGMGNNPITNIDRDGGCVECPEDGGFGDIFIDSEGIEWHQMGEDGNVFWGTTGLADMEQMISNQANMTIPAAFLLPELASSVGVSLSGVGLATIGLASTLQGDTDYYAQERMSFARTGYGDHSLMYEADDISRRSNNSGYYFHYTTMDSAYWIYQSGVLKANKSGKVYVTNALLAPFEAFNILFQAQNTHKGRGNAVIIMKLHRYQESSLDYDKGDVYEQYHRGNLKPEKIIYAGPNPFGGSNK